MTSEPDTLLVVDDNRDNRDVLIRRLEKEGFRTLEAEDGREALAHVARGGISLVLLDIMMPDMSGLDVLRSIRATHSAVELPVVMVTARTQSEDVVEALGLGANDYVTKPLDFAVVVARIQAQLRIRQPAGEPARGEAMGPAPMGVGTLIDGRYLIEGTIGTGNFGTVFRARHLELDHPVAVKVLQTSAATSAEAVARFRREGVTACRVKHPNAVTVLDFGMTPAGIAYLVMELLAGYSLEEELRGARPLPIPRSLHLMAAVCEALAEAHRSGIVHRDVKPANIFLHHEGGREVPKVLDFGIAKIAGEVAMAKRVTVEGWIVGTPVYMAPERFRGQAVDGQADVYSAGVTLYQMLAGRLPFEAEPDAMAVAMKHMKVPPPSIRSANPRVPEAVDALVLRALRKRPDQRPTAARFAEQLSKAAGERRTRNATLPPSLKLPPLAPTEVMPAPDADEGLSSPRRGKDPR